jgi:excisionase family DNA binding protein
MIFERYPIIREAMWDVKTIEGGEGATLFFRSSLRRDKETAMKIKEEGYVALPLISIAEAADYLGVNQKTIHHFIELGEITAVRVNHTVCVEKKSLDRLKNAGKLL